MNTHILKTFDKDLQQLHEQIRTMVAAVSDQLNRAITSLEKGSDKMAEKTLIGDKKINLLEQEINETCTTILATYHPVASDLRIPIAALKMSSDLERIGDEAEKLATVTLESNEEHPANIPLLTMAYMVQRTFQHVSTAFENNDTALFLSILEDEGSLLHKRYDKTLHEIFFILAKQPKKADENLAYLWAIKGLERISDHIRNLCQQFIYMETGKKA